MRDGEPSCRGSPFPAQMAPETNCENNPAFSSHFPQLPVKGEIVTNLKSKPFDLDLDLDVAPVHADAAYAAYVAYALSDPGVYGLGPGLGFRVQGLGQPWTRGWMTGRMTQRRGEEAKTAPSETAYLYLSVKESAGSIPLPVIAISLNLKP